MAIQLEANVTLTNDKVQFTGVSGSNPAVKFDYTPPIGDGQGYTSLELLLMSLATCSGTSVVVLLRKMRKTVAGFSVNAKGIRRDQNPTSFREISLEFILTSPDAEDHDIEKAIRMSEESFCPVWAMVKGNVEITTAFRIIAS
jgi:putative redox protein